VLSLFGLLISPESLVREPDSSSLVNSWSKESLVGESIELLLLVFLSLLLSMSLVIFSNYSFFKVYCLIIGIFIVPFLSANVFLDRSLK